MVLRNYRRLREGEVICMVHVLGQKNWASGIKTGPLSDLDALVKTSTAAICFSSESTHLAVGPAN